MKLKNLFLKPALSLMRIFGRVAQKKPKSEFFTSRHERRRKKRLENRGRPKWLNFKKPYKPLVKEPVKEDPGAGESSRAWWLFSSGGTEP